MGKGDSKGGKDGAAGKLSNARQAVIDNDGVLDSQQAEGSEKDTARRIVIRGIDNGISEDAIRQELEKYGVIESFVMDPRDATFVCFEQPRAAKHVLGLFELKGCTVNVTRATAADVDKFLRAPESCDATAEAVDQSDDEEGTAVAEPQDIHGRFSNRRLWIGGVHHTTAAETVRRRFERFGKIEEIDIFRGMAYILFEEPSAAALVPDECEMEGRQCKVKFSNEAEYAKKKAQRRTILQAASKKAKETFATATREALDPACIRRRGEETGVRPRNIPPPPPPASSPAAARDGRSLGTTDKLQTDRHQTNTRAQAKPKARRPPPWHQEVPSGAAPVAEDGRRISITGLNSDISEGQLHNAFNQFGPIDRVETGFQRLAFVLFKDASSAARAAAGEDRVQALAKLSSSKSSVQLASIAVRVATTRTYQEALRKKPKGDRARRASHKAAAATSALSQKTHGQHLLRSTSQRDTFGVKPLQPKPPATPPTRGKLLQPQPPATPPPEKIRKAHAAGGVRTMQTSGLGGARAYLGSFARRVARNERYGSGEPTAAWSRRQPQHTEEDEAWQETLRRARASVLSKSEGHQPAVVLPPPKNGVNAKGLNRKVSMVLPPPAAVKHKSHPRPSVTTAGQRESAAKRKPPPPPPAQQRPLPGSSGSVPTPPAKRQRVGFSQQEPGAQTSWPPPRPDKSPPGQWNRSAASGPLPPPVPPPPGLWNSSQTSGAGGSPSRGLEKARPSAALHGGAAAAKAAHIRTGAGSRRTATVRHSVPKPPQPAVAAVPKPPPPKWSETKPSSPKVPRPPAHPPKLPLGWERHWDEKFQSYYYWNEVTDESSWQRPVAEKWH